MGEVIPFPGRDLYSVKADLHPAETERDASPGVRVLSPAPPVVSASRSVSAEAGYDRELAALVGPLCDAGLSAAEVTRLVHAYTQAALRYVLNIAVEHKESPMPANKRFEIRGPDGTQEFDFPDVGPVLSRAITQATVSGTPGVWTVIEWGGEAFQVTRTNEPFRVVTEQV